MRTRALRAAVCVPVAALAACAANPDRVTLADLREVEADLSDIRIEDSLERAEQSYRRYLEQTPSTAMTPEAMRRLADLQIEKEFGIIGSGELIEMAVAEDAETVAGTRTSSGLDRNAYTESREEFERRSSAAHQFEGEAAQSGIELPEGETQTALAGPLEAIETYRHILETYPDYERNDQVLYQMSRAYDELGRNEEAMDVMQRLVAEYPESRYIDEVYFRRGEFYFVRKKYLDAEEAYGAIIAAGPASSYYELALYKLGWTLYKQELYEEALHRYIAMLDHRLSIGYDFDQPPDGSQDDEHRVADTFRVISLSFSNLGGPEVIDEYFASQGQRSYADRIYSNLGEFYLDKLRYQDAAAVYGSFVELNPYHRVAPYFGMRIVEIYEAGEFPQLVVESKKDFAGRYALDADYWEHFDPAESPEVLGFLKTNLTDLANHYHALYQHEELVDERPVNYEEALTWYRQFLASFPQEPESPAINYQLADLLLEDGDFGQAAREYERTAYDYASHEKAAAAGYAAVFAHREHLAAAGEMERREIRRATVDSSLRFAEAFPGHGKAATVLGAAADDLYDMGEFSRAIASARTLIERYPGAEPELVRSAWIVVAHSSIDTEQYEDAEQAYASVLVLTAPDDESRPAIVDGLAASIYKQGERARDAADFRAAAGHFLRIQDAAPASAIGTIAQYDAAGALVELQDWTTAAEVLERFRSANGEHELATEATQQLAFIYREDGQLDRSAAEHVRMADESDDPEFSREALLTAGELYEDAADPETALSVYERYVASYPRPLGPALETRNRIAGIYRDRDDVVRYHDTLREIVAADATAGEERSPRTRYLAGQAALVLAEVLYERFAELPLVQPFEQSLAEKQARMDAAMAALEALVDYEVAEVTAAATYYIAEIYYGFSEAMLGSERPAGLSGAELTDYELVLEEEAYPFEERAIAVHEENYELLAVGVYNAWVQRSLDELAELMPGRYAKHELSTGFMGSIDFYAYRMPIAPELAPGGEELSGSPEPAESASLPAATATVSQTSEAR